MACLLEKRMSALPIPKKKTRMTMATFLFSLVGGCEGVNGLCHHLLEKEGVCLSSPKKEGVMTMVIFFHTSVESCGGDHG